MNRFVLRSEVVSRHLFLSLYNNSFNLLLLRISCIDRIFIGRFFFFPMTAQVTEEDLAKYFGLLGEVNNVIMLRDKFTNRHKVMTDFVSLPFFFEPIYIYIFFDVSVASPSSLAFIFFFVVFSCCVIVQLVLG